MKAFLCFIAGCLFSVGIILGFNMLPTISARFYEQNPTIVVDVVDDTQNGFSAVVLKADIGQNLSSSLINKKCSFIIKDSGDVGITAFATDKSGAIWSAFTSHKLYAEPGKTLCIFLNKFTKTDT